MMPVIIGHQEGFLRWQQPCPITVLPSILRLKQSAGMVAVDTSDTAFKVKVVSLLSSRKNRGVLILKIPAQTFDRVFQQGIRI